MIVGSSLAVTTLGWTYHYSNKTMNWTEARLYCQSNYTDMVVIQSQIENDYLVSYLPERQGSPYYWIGITKNHMNETWTWIGNNSTWVGNESWAENEPNNNHSTEFCVEIYIKKGKNRGKWNDEKCSHGKRPVCYKAQCNATSCGRGTCQEAIKNITCLCETGFKGDRCQTVLNHTNISGGGMNCSHPIAPYSYNSTCEVRCDEGYELSGGSQMRCEHTGRWTASVPACTIKKCSPIFSPVTGNVTCVDTLEPFSFGSRCNFNCQEGYNLTGDSTLTCLASGQWSKATPTCTVVQCNSLEAPPHASVQCQDPLGVYSYGSICTVQCEEGFDLIGTNMTQCSSQGSWSHTLPVCQAKKCNPINSPPHGSLSCSDPHGSFSFGSRCMTTCDEGFLLNGTANAECTSLGMWSADIAHCSGKENTNCLHPAAVNCSQLVAQLVNSWFRFWHHFIT
uniref:E-selectin n=1 Tax=Seriola dumerili TaxID=41447 RepID=A0A3B4U048_SERDU